MKPSLQTPRGEASSMRAARRSIRWWMRDPLASGDRQLLAGTIMLSLLVYFGVHLVLDDDVTQPSETDAADAVVETAGGGPDVAPLDWVGKKVEVHWPRNGKW